MEPTPDTPTRSRSSRIVALTVIVVAASAALAFWIAELRVDPGSRALPRIVALVGVALAGLAVASMCALKRMDELARKIHTEAMAFGFLGSILIVAAYTYLDAAGLETPPLHWMLPAITGCWALGVLVSFPRYR